MVTACDIAETRGNGESYWLAAIKMLPSCVTRTRVGEQLLSAQNIHLRVPGAWRIARLIADDVS